jgi:hypothetical protein
MRINSGKFDIVNILSTLTVMSGINKTLKDQKNSIISYMAYSSVLKLLWQELMPLPFDQERRKKAI